MFYRFIADKSIAVRGGNTQGKSKAAAVVCVK